MAASTEPLEPASGWAGPPTESGHFRADIEGLRAVAVMAVLLFHVGVPGFAGGFTGVDVFYVISGFLITGLLIREVDKTGRIRLASFYARRLRRLLPAALVVILATLALSTLALSTLKLQGVAGDAVASALYVANYRFALESIDYLADTAASPLLHYWSLAVEEQFYLVWPLLVLVSVRLLSLKRLGWVVGFVAVSSFAVALILTDVAPPLSFFSLPSRAWELAIGALIAIWLGRRSQRHIPSVVSQGAGLVGLLLIVGSAILIDPQQPFPSLTALAPTIGAALVIVAGSGRTAVGALLSTALPRYLGRISYSLYLWHWPIITLIPLLIARDDLLTRLALAAASIAIAALSTRWIEERFRERTGDGRVRLSSPRVLGIAVGSSLGVAGVAIATAWTAMLLLPSSFTGSPSGPLPESAQAVISKPVVSGPLPLDLRPSVLGSQDDLPDAYRDGCLRGALVTTAQPCFYGDEASAKTVLLFGDSKAVQWLPTLQRLAEDGDLRIVLLAKGGCTPADVGIWNDRLHRPSRECASWRDGAFAEIDRLQPDLVVMSSSPYYEIVTGSTSTTVAESPDLWREGLSAALSRVSQAADQVVLLASSPRLPMSPTECFATQTDIADCEVPADAAVVELYERLELEAANASGARYATLNDVLCSETCPLVFDHFNVYRDVSHLTATFAEILADEVAREVGLVGSSDSETGEPRD